MITLPNGVEVHISAGAKLLSGTLDNSAAADASSGFDRRAIDLADTTHGLIAGSDIFFDNIKASTTYLSNQMRNIISLPDANSMVVSLDRREAFAAVTPAGTEGWCVGYTNPNPYFFLGFELHLNAADASGEALTITKDAKAGTYWDTLLFNKASMIGVTDIIWFPAIRIPLLGGDVIKFAWTNTGGKTWGVQIHTLART